MTKSEITLTTKNYLAEAKVRNHFLVFDEPVDLGGDDNAPTPVEYLLSALGACVSITLRMYAQRKGWDLGVISVNVIKEEKQTKDGIEQSLTEEISFEKEPNKEQKDRLLEIAAKCPVAKMIKGQTVIESKLI